MELKMWWEWKPIIANHINGIHLRSCTFSFWQSILQGLHKQLCMNMQKMTEPLRPQRITKKVHTWTHKLQVRPGYSIQACCTQAGSAHSAGRGDGMDRWQHSSHLLPHALPVAILESNDFNTGMVSQATKTNVTDRLPCSYVNHSRPLHR